MSKYEKQCMGLVNQLYDLAEVPVEKRQYINDKAFDYTIDVVKNIAYEPVLAVVHRKNEYGEICYCKDDEINCDLCRFSVIPMKGNSVCEKCYDRLKSNEYYR